MIHIGSFQKWDELKETLGPVIYASIGSTWWGCDVLYRRNDVPSDPHGHTLVKFTREEFLTNLDPRVYGRHGIHALVAAYHGNICYNNRPTCLENWDKVNELLDNYKMFLQPFVVSDCLTRMKDALSRHCEIIENEAFDEKLEQSVNKLCFCLTQLEGSICEAS